MRRALRHLLWNFAYSAVFTGGLIFGAAVLRGRLAHRILGLVGRWRQPERNSSFTVLGRRK